MTREIEIFAELSVCRNGRKVLITAEGSSVTVHFEGLRFFCREYEWASKNINFKHLLNKLDSACQGSKLYIYAKIGRFTFTAFGPDASPVKRAILLRLISLFGKLLKS